jgi:ATP-binding cassette subfamily F protein uup
VIGYLRDFLFSAERARTAVKFLSGGERNRVLLARLFAKPANIVVLDEPTNDLDAETLELLEQRLVDFPGTVLVVSHDRAFLNAIATSTLVFATTTGCGNAWRQPTGKPQTGKPQTGKQPTGKQPTAPTPNAWRQDERPSLRRRQAARQEGARQAPTPREAPRQRRVS